MPKLTIRPASVLLTSGQAATFEAVDDTGAAVHVNWEIIPQIGTLSFPEAPATSPTPAPPAGGAAPAPAAPQTPPPDAFPSATYIAPLSASSQMVSVVANSGSDSGSATICLTSDPMAIIPAKVELRPSQQQQFVAIVAGTHALPQPPLMTEPAISPPGPQVKWILNPPIGTLDENGLYTAPSDI